MEDNRIQKRKENVVMKQDKIEKMKENIILDAKGGKNNMYYRAVLGAALGSIPWIGGIYSTLIALQAESEQKETNDLHKIWLLEHQEKIMILGETLKRIIVRLEELNKSNGVEKMILERIQSTEYLNLVRETFKSWDDASTKEKREMFRRLITNAAAIELCSDDLVRVFIKWIQEYHEFHFQVVAEIYNNQTITRGKIWDNLFGERPREDSAEADLYKYLIRELTLGGVIRQERQVNAYGEYMKKGRKTKSSSSTMKSAFDDVENYELTELGAQFIHYVMEDVVPQISSAKNNT